MIDQQALDYLWGGTIKAHELSLQDNHFRCHIDVVDHDQTNRYVLTCSNVKEFRFVDEETTDWDFVELTSVVLKQPSTTGAINLVLELWGGVAKIAVRCGDIQLGGAADD